MAMSKIRFKIVSCYFLLLMPFNYKAVEDVDDNKLIVRRQVAVSTHLKCNPRGYR